MQYRKIHLAMLAVLLSLPACSRLMTDGEISYNQAIFTEELSFGDVRFSGQKARGMRRAQKQLAKEVEGMLAVSDEDENASRLVSALPSLFGAAAIAVGNTVYFDSEVYSDDFAKSLYDSDRWLMAHEVTHVWQWQNRTQTGYSFAKVVSEHLEFGDEVYEYTLVNGKRFSEYRFEQQGRIVQCFAMLQQLRPNDPLTLRHEKLIRAEFPLDSVLELVGSRSAGTIRVRNKIDQVECAGR